MNAAVNSKESDLLSLLRRQRESFMKEGPPSVAVRVDRMRRLISAFESHEEQIVAALEADYGGRTAMLTRWAEVATPISQLRHAITQVELWMQPEERPVDLALGAGRGYILHQPLGVVGVVSPWNVPFAAGFAGFGNILAAGNRVMIKMSEHAPQSAELAKRMLAATFDATEAVAVTGDWRVGAEFAGLPFDHILYTGGAAVAKEVLRAAAANLTPVTLELGGKCPVVLGTGADLEKAVPKVMEGRLANGGQICVAPDYVLLPQGKVEEFIERARASVLKLYPTIQGNPDYTSMISKRHYDRVLGYVSEARLRGVRVEELGPASESSVKATSGRKMPPVLIINPPADLAVCQEEIFGPILPVIGYDDIEEAFQYVNERERPLALYYFGLDSREQQRIIHGTWSGGLTVNDVARHVGQLYLPFGGVGASGMGRYQAYEGFKTFSNGKVVFESQ